MSFAIRLTEQAARSVDTADMSGHISRMGAHLREAMGFARSALNAASAQLAHTDEIDAVVVAGIGGSAIGGDLARTYLSDKCVIPFAVNRDYRLPGFVDERTLVIVSSYSGNTEESLSMFEDAVARKAKIVCISTGGAVTEKAKKLSLLTILEKPGMQPRAALAFSFVPILMLLHQLGFIEDPSRDVEGCASLLDSLSEEYGLTNIRDENRAYELAGHLMHRIPVVYSASDHYEAINLRWRGQFQENAKHLAFGNVLPEMNHNEINGWDHPIDVLQHLCVILLRAPQDEHTRVSRRFAILSELLSAKGMTILECTARGNTRLERMFSLIALADWTSLYLALLNGTDPTPIPAIDLLKNRLAS